MYLEIPPTYYDLLKRIECLVDDDYFSSKLKELEKMLQEEKENVRI